MASESVRPLTPAAIIGHLVALAVDTAATGRPADEPVRIALDGAAAADPGSLADQLVDPLLAAGRAARRVAAAGFLRPRSLRFEHGQQDPDSFYEDWFDLGALRREVLRPLGPGGDGRYLPALWDSARDRATRARRDTAPPGFALLVDGPFLLGSGLPFDLTVHLQLSPAALLRQTPPDERWTMPAFARYQAEVSPEAVADVVLRMDDPRHPALLLHRPDR